MRDEALAYAGRGWPVHPLAVGGKVPATRNGCKDATTNPATIAAWWAVHPYNIGIATGAPGPDVLDVDVSGDGSGWAAFNKIKRAGLVRGAHRLVRTRNGGLHVYFAGTDQRNAAGIGKATLDFRGQGGYVVAPPSLVEPGTYEIMQDRAPTGVALDLARIKAFLTPPAPPRRAAFRPRTGASTDLALAAYVATVTVARHDNYFWAACRAVENGVTDFTNLMEAGRAIGLEENYLERAIRNAQNRSVEA